MPLVEMPGPWVGIHRLVHEPLYFGRSRTYRFDAPTGAFGVLYVGADALAAFVETFGWHTGAAAIDLADLEARGLAEIRTSRALRLVDLTGPGLAQLGADARLVVGDDYPVSRRWSRALWVHPAQPDGIYYPSRHDPSRRSAALFDRVAAALTADLIGSLAASERAVLLAELLATYGFALADDSHPLY